MPSGHVAARSPRADGRTPGMMHLIGGAIERSRRSGIGRDQSAGASRLSSPASSIRRISETIRDIASST